MTMWDSARRISKRYTGTTLLRAAVVTAVIPSVAAAFLLWLVPTGCDIRREMTEYRWTCLLPGLLLVVSLPLAVCLPIATIINQRLNQPIPNGWLSTILAVGVITQIVLAGVYLIVLNPAYRSLFFAEAIFIPQPFVAGATAGAVYWTALNWGGDRRP